MEWINSSNKEYYIKLMARHYKHTKTEEEIRKEVEDDPTVLEGFVEFLADGGKVGL